MAKKKRHRTERRAFEREARKLADARERLAALSAGGAAERPLEVPSASTVEGTAVSLGCARCEGEARLEAHDAVAAPDGRLLRRVTLSCKRCGATRAVWLRVVPDLPS